MALQLESSLWGSKRMVPVDERLAHFAGLAYGDGYPAWGEVRVVTYNEQFAKKLVSVVELIAKEFDATFREYVRPGNVSDNLQHNIVLNSTLVRRALFDDQMHPRYDAIHDIAMEDNLAPHFQGGLSDAESTLLPSVEIESPHGRVFAVVNSDRRLLGIARLSLVNKLRLEPTSVRTRLASKKGRRHILRGLEFVTRKNSYLIEILSGAKRKWLVNVGSLLWHPAKLQTAQSLLVTYSL
jgi:hypothetical protein